VELRLEEEDREGLREDVWHWEAGVLRVALEDGEALCVKLKVVETEDVWEREKVGEDDCEK